MRALATFMKSWSRILSRKPIFMEICSPKTEHLPNLTKSRQGVLKCSVLRGLSKSYSWLVLGYPDSLTDSLTDSQGTLRWEPTRSAIGGKFITGHCLRMNWEEDTRGTKENTQMHPRCTTLLNRARDGSLMMPYHAILAHNLVCFAMCQVKHGPYKQTWRMCG